MNSIAIAFIIFGVGAFVGAVAGAIIMCMIALAGQVTSVAEEKHLDDFPRASNVLG